MDLSLLFFFALALSYVGAVIYLANVQESERASVPQRAFFEGGAPQRETLLRWLLYGLAAMNFVSSLLILQIALFSGIETALPSETQLMPVPLPAALGNFALGVAVTWFSVRLVASQAARDQLQRFISARGSFDSRSSVHTAAVVLSLALLSVTVGQLVLSGGLSGLAQDIEGGGVSVNALVFQGALMLAASFLGVGLAIRRSLPDSLRRLGLRWPTPQDISWGIGTGVLLYFALIVMFSIWMLAVPIEQISEQSAAAEELSRAFRTVPLAFALSATSAVSEEVLFRGALQPVFGLWITSVFFALVHMQYTLTPATLIIFVVAVGLGWLRQRQSTTAAIIAHFTYNFVIQLIAIVAAGAAG